MRCDMIKELFISPRTRFVTCQFYVLNRLIVFFRRSYIKNLAFDVRYTEIFRNFILANHSDSTYDMQDIGTLN